MARFFIVSVNYAPEPTGFAPKATAFAEHLARQGHEVLVFTGFPFAPDWSRRAEYRGRLFSRERAGNLTVHRVTHYNSAPAVKHAGGLPILRECHRSGGAACLC